MINKIKKVIQSPMIILRFFIAKKVFYYMPDRLYLQIFYYSHLGKWINFKNPITFNEKLQWLKLYNRQDVYTQLVDKLKVKSYVIKKIGPQYVIPTLGHWKTTYEIDLENLPEQFVLKCTHDSGSTIFCHNKEKFNIENAFAKLEKALKDNYYKKGREWPYKNVLPQIIAEPLLTRNPEELLDYKFMCFNGAVKCIFVCSNRNDTFVNVTFFDLNWNQLPFERHYPRSSKPILKPANLNLMIELSEKLARDISFVRVDFYEVSNRVYFGEMTFFPGSGIEEFHPIEYDKILGSWLTLPQKRK